jgi:hypothetical protein
MDEVRSATSQPLHRICASRSSPTRARPKHQRIWFGPSRGLSEVPSWTLPAPITQNVARGRKVMRIPGSTRFGESCLRRCRDVNPPGGPSSPRRRPSPSRQGQRERASKGRTRRSLRLTTEPIAKGQASMGIMRPQIGSRCGKATQHVQRSPSHHLGVSVVDTDISRSAGDG